MSGEAQLALPGLFLSEPPHEEWVFTDILEDELNVQTFEHKTIMAEEITQAICDALPPEGGFVVDATLGGGGHTEALLKAHSRVHIIALDRDPSAREAASKRLLPFADRLTIVPACFGELSAVLETLNVNKIQGFCADLGVSSPQLDTPSRGMSFRREGPIDMRMDPTQGETALELMERLSDDELANFIYRYGDERKSRRIAKSIKRALFENELHTTLDLRKAIVRATGPVRLGGVDPATRTFQALRIEVNQEISELQKLLASLPELLDFGAVAALLSFHSLEDREVKHLFANKKNWRNLSKKPRIPSDTEQSENVRARSAKLRTAVRIREEDVDSEMSSYKRKNREPSS